MKKVFSIVLLLVYGLSSTGMTLHAHYCCGELEKIDFRSTVCKEDCPAQPEVNGKSCCDEKQISFSFKTEYNNTKFIQSFETTDAVRPVRTEMVYILLSSSSRIIPEIFAPPLLTRNLHILYSVYRI